MEKQAWNDFASQLLGELSPKLFDPLKAKQLEMDTIRGEPPVCPFCGATLSKTISDRLLQGKKIRCPVCGKGSNLRTGTVLAGSTLSSQEFVFIVWCFALDVPISNIAEATGISLSALYRWHKRLSEK